MRELTPAHLRTWTLGLAAATLALLPLASAHSNHDEHATLTAHDEAGGPAVIDVPDCTAHFQARHMKEPAARFVLYQNHGRGGVREVYAANVTGTPDGDGGWSWESGPVVIEGDHAWHLAELIFGDEKVEKGNDPLHAESVTVHIHCGRPYVGCVQHITAEALDAGHVRLTWSAAANATFYRVQRYVGDLPNGAPDYDTIGETRERSFVDTTAKPGDTHTYRIDAWNETDGGRGVCRESVTITAVPFFGAPLFGALALAGTVGAYAWMRRR